MTKAEAIKALNGVLEYVKNKVEEDESVDTLKEKIAELKEKMIEAADSISSLVNDLENIDLETD